MNIVKLTIGGKTLDCADCTHWTLHENDARCAIGIEPMVCATCEHGIPRQRLTPKPAPSIASRAVSWAKAEISRVVKGPVSEDQYRDRLEICNGCQNLQRANEAGKLGWCTACGCGERGRAELTIKATMPEAKCPTGAWDNLAAKRVPLEEPKG